MFGEGRPEEIFVGVIALVLALVLAARVRRADATGEIPLYRTRKTKAELGETKFKALLLLNIAAMVALIAVGLDLILQLGLR